MLVVIFFETADAILLKKHRSLRFVSGEFAGWRRKVMGA